MKEWLKQRMAETAFSLFSTSSTLVILGELPIAQYFSTGFAKFHRGPMTLMA